jgi:excinuclease ABC subunit A
VLDEPSIGLHQRDNDRLIGTLRRLRDLGNSVIVVEHDEDTIREADHVIDLGPGAGARGGQLVAQGTLAEVLAVENSLTAQYLSGRAKIPVPKQRHRPQYVAPQNRSDEHNPGWLTITGARENNLQSVTASFPLGCLTCVTGVSGSGKSTLVDDILRRALFRHFYRSKDRPGKYAAIHGLEQVDKAIVIDQTPIGRTPRSNPVTYTGAFGPIRELFAGLPASRIRGYDAGRFSFNVKGGRCETCEGDGVKKIEMHFLADVYVECEVCRGRRYNRETLEITYKGKNVADILDLTVDEAARFFRNVTQIHDKLVALEDVGLGYVRLGQSGTTLSGGEAQRIKLAAELAKKATGRTVYILDEPTTGLHFADIHKLLEVLAKLRDAGNTLVIIEHNLEVIKCADWVLDLGPEGGAGGGRIVAQGTPERIAEIEESHTGRYLRRML